MQSAHRLQLVIHARPAQVKLTITWQDEIKNAKGITVCEQEDHFVF
jgi:hypothetical protein